MVVLDWDGSAKTEMIMLNHDGGAKQTVVLNYDGSAKTREIALDSTIVSFPIYNVSMS